MPLPLAIPIASAAISAGTGLYKAISGIKGRRDAKKKLESLVKPIYESPEEIENNQNVAQYWAQQGLDQRSITEVRRGLERGLTSNNQAAMRVGGGINAIGRNYDQYSTGLGKLAMENNKALQQNINRAMQANLGVAREKKFKFLHEYKDFQTEENRALKEKAQATQNIISGFGQIANAGMSLYKATSTPGLGKTGTGTGTEYEGVPKGYQPYVGDTSAHDYSFNPDENQSIISNEGSGWNLYDPFAEGKDDSENWSWGEDDWKILGGFYPGKK